MAHFQWLVEVYRLRIVAFYLLLLLFLWFAAATTLCWSERATGIKPGDRFYSLNDCLWYSTVYLLSGLEEYEPRTAAGKTSALVVMLAGVGVLGLLGTTLLASIVESVGLSRKVKFKPSVCKLQDHIVLCGWNEKGDAIIHELHSQQFSDSARRPIVIVAEEADEIKISDHRAYEGVWGVTGDPTQHDVLQRADIKAAHSVIIMSPRRDEASKSLGTHGADATTILRSLAVQGVAPKIHTCAEVLDGANVQHFRRTSVNELVNVRSVAARIIGHASQKHYLTQFFMRLLTVSSDTNEVYCLPIPKHFVGATFRKLQHLFIDHGKATIVGIMRNTPVTKDGEILRDRLGEQIVVPLHTINPRVGGFGKKALPLAAAEEAAAAKTAQKESDNESADDVSVEDVKSAKDVKSVEEDENAGKRYFEGQYYDDLRIGADEELIASDQLVIIAHEEPNLAHYPSPK